MDFQKELRHSKQVVREWVRAHFSDQRLASVAAFNEDGRMGFRNPCGCLMGVTFSDRLSIIRVLTAPITTATASIIGVHAGWIFPKPVASRPCFYRRSWGRPKRPICF